ncbi:MAG: hypothetical protein ACFFE4_00575 [Candidatus Thorarchaeota archaeon]
MNNDKLKHFGMNFACSYLIHEKINNEKTKNIAVISLISIFLLKECLYDKKFDKFDVVFNILGVVAGGKINF